MNLLELERAQNEQRIQGSLYKTLCDDASELAKKAVKETISNHGLAFKDFDGEEDLRFLLAVDETTGNNFRNIWNERIKNGDEWMNQTYKKISVLFACELYDEIKNLENHSDLSLLESLVRSRTIALLESLQGKYGNLEPQNEALVA